MLRAMPKLLYFAQLVDAVGIAFEDLQPNVEPVSVADLLARLAKRGDTRERVFSQPQNLRIAVNKSFAKLHTAVRHSDEVAFVPSGPVL